MSRRRDRDDDDSSPSPFVWGFNLTFGIIAALVLVFVALPVFCIGGFFFFNALHSSKPAAQQAAHQDVHQDADHRPVAPVGPVADPVKSDPNMRLPTPNDSIIFGEIEVFVDSISVDFVPLKDFRGNGKSADKLLMVKLRLRNSSNTKKIDYHGWQPDFVGLLGEPASLADDKGNDYKRITFGIDKVAGRISRGESIYPGKEITDVLVFEEPVATCKYLILSLPSAALKADKDAKVRIPRSFWDPNAPIEKPPVETKPEPPVATPAEKLPPPTPKEEADAMAFLREAREFLKNGNRKLAGDDLRKVLADYPDTKAAAEARDLLAALGQ